MYFMGCVRVNLQHNGKSITHHSQQLWDALSAFCLLTALCLLYTNKWYFKFQRRPPRRQSQKQLNSPPGTLMIFKSSHTGADNNMIDTAKTAMLVSHVMEILKESIAAKYNHLQRSCKHCGFLILQEGWKGNLFIRTHFECRIRLY